MRGGEQRANLIVHGGFEFAIELADGGERFRALERDELVHLLADLLAGSGGSHRNSNDHAAGDRTQRANRGPHGRAGRQAIIDHDDGAAGELGSGPALAISDLAAADFLLLASNDRIQHFTADRIQPQHLIVQHDDATAGHRAHREFRFEGHAQLAHDKDIHRQVEFDGDLVGHGNASARQCQHDGAFKGGLLAKRFREGPSGVATVGEYHADLGSRAMRNHAIANRVFYANRFPGITLMSTIAVQPITGASQRRSFRSFLAVCLAFSGLKLAIQVVGNIVAQHAGYGIFRDELYYLVCGRHLAFGYVDLPPMAALQARVSEMLFGFRTMALLRLISALAGAAKVFLTGALVWAMGGNRRAAALAMLGVTVAGVYLGIDGFLSMNSFEPVFWMTCALALLRIVQEHGVAGKDRVVRNWWIVLGVSAGLGLENKDNEVFFLVAVLIALLLTPQRRILASRWFGAAVAIIVALALPNLLWQVHYHFPTLEWLVRVSKSSKDVKLPPLQFLAGQVMMLNPFTAPLWISGAIWLLTAKPARRWLFLGVLYPVFLLLMMALHAKDYYLAPIYVIYFAAGAICWFGFGRQRIWRNALTGAYAALLVFAFIRSVPFSIPVLSPPEFIRYERKIGFTPKDTENHAATALPQFYADRFGWREMVEKTAKIYDSLTPQERAVAGIYADNYGEASAINILGRKDGLPTAISTHQNYWIWGPGSYTGQVMIVISGASPAKLEKYFGSCQAEAQLDHPLSMPWEKKPIYLCRSTNARYAADWKDLKNYY